MAVVGFDVISCTLLARGIAFGEVGQYQEITGTLRVAVDPGNAANRLITDLDLAPRESDGLVHFDLDLVLTAPVRPWPNGRLLVDVPNRGRPLTARLNSAEGYPAASIDDVGNGFLMRQGFTIARCGWQYDAPQEPGRVRLRGPVAHNKGVPITGPALCHFQIPARAQSILLSDRDHVPYPAADLDDGDAVLMMRPYLSAARTMIPRSQWRFARDQQGTPVSDPNYLWLESGFEPGLLYELVYTAANASIVGLGLVAVRDVASWLRFAEANTANPCADRLRYVLGYGESQTGRLLREFLYYGLNRDEAGRKVYDGMFITVAGARRGEFNIRFGQPSRTLCDGPGAMFPFHDIVMIDPVTLQRDGLLSRFQDDADAPKVITVNASTEYWGGDRGSGGQSSLLQCDIAGTSDVDPPENSRVYMLAGTQHLPGVWPMGTVDHLSVRCAQPLCAIDHRPLQRALLVALDQWVGAGVEPPSSKVPRLVDGTAAEPAKVLARLKAVPGFTQPEHLPELRRLAFELASPGVIASLPPMCGELYSWFVSAVDSDGNEIAGIRHPDIAVPLATYTGHNVRHLDAGAPGELVPMAGATYPFPATTQLRHATNDPRPAIEERYPNRDAYVEQVRSVAEALVNARLLLQEDVATVLQQAGAKYDVFSSRK
jgi:hypothetical protein